MFNPRATFNAWVRSLMDSGIPLHVEPSEVTLWPSCRVVWLGSTEGTRDGGKRSLVEVTVSLKGGDTAGLWQRVDRLAAGLGLQVYGERPRILVKDWSDPLAPVDLDPSHSHNWIEYGYRAGGGWTDQQPDDPDSRQVKATLELFYYAV